jgi:hypothetical protein
VNDARARVGLVDVTDLTWARPWQSRTKAVVDALGLALGWQSYVDVRPPPSTILIVRRYASHFASCAWFRAHSDVTVVVDARAESRTPADRAIEELDDDEIERAIGVKPSLVWDGTADSTAKFRVLIDDVAARPVAPTASGTSAPVHGTSAPPGTSAPSPSPGTSAQAAAPLVGGSRPLPATRHFAATRWMNVNIDHAWRGRISSRIFLRGAHVSFAEHRRYLDLDDGGAGVHLALPDDAAIAHDGRRLLRRGDRGENDRRPYQDLIDIVSGALIASVEAHGIPFAFDASGFAACGYRTAFEWLFVDDADETKLFRLGGSAHDWPVGHAKKLYGYMDNSPRSLDVAPDLGAYASIFDVDALLASALPFRWRSAGNLAVLDPSSEDSLRRLFFIPDFTHWSLPDDAKEDKSAAILEEDVRAGAPPLVVGPRDDLRYAVGLDRDTWCLFGTDSAQHVGGPDDGYAIFDASHAVVRRGHGRLLGGTARHLAVVDEAERHVFVESFDGSSREDRGEIDRKLERAIAVPHSDNFVLVAAVDHDDDDDEPRTNTATLRVI